MLKKLIYSAAILATVASCSKHVETETVYPNESSIIGFRNLSDRVMPTKVAPKNKVNYIVYSQYSTAANGWFISEENVTANESGNDTSEETHMWPAKTSLLDFYAYAPQTSTNISAAATPPAIGAKGNVLLTYTVPTEADEDFIVATPLTDKNKLSHSGTVPFVFQHMLAKVEIHVKSGSNKYTVAWEKIELSGNKAKKGTVEITASAPAVVPGTAETITYTHNASTTASFMIIPQLAAGFTVSVTGVTITHTESGKIVIQDDLAFDFKPTYTEITNFEAGKLYNLYFTVAEEGSEIKFTSTTTDWAAGGNAGGNKLN